jgi:hypothetical protein
VYVDPANVSYVPRLLLFVPALPESRAQTEKRYVPAGSPVVVQLNVAVVE